MKTNKITKSLAVLLTVASVGFGINILPAQAGLKEVVRDTSTVQDEINESVWHNANGDVSAENGVIVFPNNSIGDTKLIVKAKAQANEGVDNVVAFSGKLRFTSLPKGEKFVLGLGLNSIEANLGEAGNVEITFTNTGSLTAGITAYNENGEAVEVMSAKKCGSMNGTDVKAILKADQTLQVSIGGSTVFNGKLPVSGEGRIGFIQTGSCGVKVEGINITFYDYERPENCNIYADFESGDFNKNLLTSKLIYRSYYDQEPYVGIDEIDGNKVFRFRNTPLSYLSTQYKYSNFEMTFDVPYIQKSNVVDEEGKVTNNASSQMIITFGGEAATYNDYGHETAAERLLLREMSAITRKDGTTTASEFPFFDPTYDKGFSVKIRMVDNLCTVSMKWIDESKWTEILSYGIQTPTGTIQIWGQSSCNWAIDNLKIENLDLNPNLIEVDYASSIIPVPADYDYQPAEKVYMKEEEQKKDTSLYWVIPMVAGVCVLALGSTIAVVAIQKRKRKDGVIDEK